MSDTKIRFGYRDITFPGPEMGELRDSSHLQSNMDACHARMAEDGYLLLRGIIDRERVLYARQAILNYMAEQQVLMPDEPVLEGVMPKGGRGARLMGKNGISHHPHVLAVLEADALFQFFAHFLDEPATTFTYKWLRAVGNEQYTGAHCDTVYMGLGSQKLHTVWIPFGDIPVEQGTLAMCVGSHTDPGFEKIRQTYGRMDVDRDHTEGWFSRDPLEIAEIYGGRWQTTNFRAGDVMIFGMYTMHASTTNLTNRFRLSCDVRYQPASDPVDSRWGGEHLTGHTVHGQQPLRSMEEARAEWGV
jgi:ectoine hydroxylase-related dioxygenase (phytanoyl-CoA dioxygenase family)